MNPDLHDIVLPEPVSWMPQTAGWWVLLGSSWWRWVARPMRPSADGAPTATAGWPWSGSTRSDLETASALPVLVKQTALAAWPRSEVAALAGDPWLRFLDASYGGTGFTEGPGRLLPALAYESRALDPDEQQALVGVVRDWIRGHRVRV